MGTRRRCAAVASSPRARGAWGAGLRRALWHLPRPGSAPAGRPRASPRPLALSAPSPRRPRSVSCCPLASRLASAAGSRRKSCWWAAAGLRASCIPGPLRPGRLGGSAVHASAAACRRDGFQSEQPVRLHGRPAGAHHHREAGPPEPQGAPRGGGTADPRPVPSPKRPGTLSESSSSPQSPCHPNPAPPGAPSTQPRFSQPGPPFLRDGPLTGGHPAAPRTPPLLNSPAQPAPKNGRPGPVTRASAAASPAPPLSTAAAPLPPAPAGADPRSRSRLTLGPLLGSTAPHSPHAGAARVLAQDPLLSNTTPTALPTSPWGTQVPCFPSPIRTSWGAPTPKSVPASLHLPEPAPYCL